MSIPKMGETSHDETLLGRRDAFHVPGILVKSEYSMAPGTKVRFTDETLTEVVPLYKEEFYGDIENEDGEVVEEDAETSLPAQAVSDPFTYGGGKESYGDNKGKYKLFWVHPLPGMVENLVHTFDVKIPDLKALTKTELELIGNAVDEEEAYESCKGCYS